MNMFLKAAGFLYDRLSEHSSKVGFISAVGGIYLYESATTPDAHAAALYAIVMGALGILVPNNKAPQ
jgi:hypothetical protein